MRSMVMAFFGLCMAGTAQASSLIYFSDVEPASTPSVVAPAAAGQNVDPSVQSAAGQMRGASVILAGEAEMPVTQEKVSAIPDRSGPARATMVIRDGVVGAALPRHMAKPVVANGKQPATEVSAKAGEDGLAKGSKPDTAR